MRSIFFKLVLFACLSLLLSSLPGCGGTSANQTANNTANANSPETANKSREKTEEEKKNSPHYRPLEKSIDQGELKNLDGSVFKVADKRGKVLLLNLWATWCGPCRAEMPTLVKMQDAHRDKGFEILGLNTDDETVEAINDFAADMKLNYTLVWADTSMQSALVGISKFPGIPQSFIVDRDGNLRGVFRGANPADVKKMEELVELIVNE